MTKKIGYESGYIYAKQKKEPKEIFKHLGRLMALSTGKDLSVLDIGCASGDLLTFLSTFPSVSECVGVDFNRNLVKVANQTDIPKCEFRFGDAQTFKLKKKFDRVTMSGVITIFDRFEPAMENLLRHLKPDGRAFVISPFNDYDIDVRIKFRNNKFSQKWQTGYNLFPIGKVTEFIQKKKWSVKVHTHVMPFDLSQQEDALRAWTTNVDGERHLMNGLHLLYNLKILEIFKGRT